MIDHQMHMHIVSEMCMCKQSKQHGHQDQTIKLLARS